MSRAFLRSAGVVTLARLCLAIVAILIVAMPCWERLGLGDAVRVAFAPFCHQRVDRSLLVGGVVLPVCARCTGLYLGALLAVLVTPLFRPARALLPFWILAAAAIPMLIDLVLEHAFGTLPHAAARFLTGITLGAGCAAVLLPALVRAGEEVLARCAAKSSTSRA